MNKEVEKLLDKKGVDVNALTGKEFQISVNASGRKEEIEKYAKELDVKVEDSKQLYMTGFEYIQLIASAITIIDFLWRLKKAYGSSLTIGIKSKITKKIVERPVDDIIESIIKQAQKTT